MAILDFSVFGWHGFGSVTQVCFRISILNFMCMSFVAVGRSLTIVSYVAFKMAALWFWTMFNCNPPIAHCHPLLWGGGILVDHWSTISSSELSKPQISVAALVKYEGNSKDLTDINIFPNKEINSSCPGKNGCHFTDDIFKCIFSNQKVWILIKISLKFVLKGPIKNNPALVWIMAWCWIGDKPLSEPMLTWFTEAYMWH